MLNYKKDGRTACIKFIADYLRENYPTKEEIDSRAQGITIKELRAQKLKEKLNKVVVKARVNLKWRNNLQERLRLNDDELIRATNTVLELFEKTLEKGEILRIRNLGDFEVKKSIYQGFQLSKVTFTPDPDWAKELNMIEDSTRLKKSYTRRLERVAEFPESS